jgi:hypothetical protein
MQPRMATLKIEQGWHEHTEVSKYAIRTECTL